MRRKQKYAKQGHQARKGAGRKTAGKAGRSHNMALRPLTTSPFDAAQYLDSNEVVIAYIEDAVETNNPAFIAHALGTVARARGMSQIAKRAGISR